MTGSDHPRSQRAATFPWWLLVPALVGVALYGVTLRLPLIYDTLLHIRITKDLNFLTVWLPTEAFGFYRPLTFLPLLVVKRLFGHYPGWLLHGLNMLQHAVNAALVAGLAWRLWRSRRGALLAGLLFVAFPFSYQAVAVYGHNVHPTLTGLLLLGLHALLTATTTRRWRPFWWGLTVVWFLLGLLSHESAILFGPLAGLVLWSSQAAKRPTTNRHLLPELQRLSPAVLAFTVAGAVYAGIYQLLPISRAPQAVETFSGGLVPKLLYLGQALAYPVTWLARVFPDVPAATVVLLGLLVTGGLFAWAGIGSREEPPARSERPVWAQDLPPALAWLAMGFGWWALAAVVVAVPLPSGYLLHGPRLLYLSGAGLALLWPLLLEPIWRLRWGGPWLWSGTVLVLLFSNVLFVRDRLAAYNALTEPVTAARAAVVDLPVDEGVLFVNLPAWTAPLRNTFPAGAELVAMMGPYLFVEELTEENGFGPRPAWAVSVPDLLARPDYAFGVHDQSSLTDLAGRWGPGGAHVVIVAYSEDGPRTRVVGAIRPGGDRPALAKFGPYELTNALVTGCDGSVTARLTWQTIGIDLPATISLFVQALDGAGQLVGQADGPPLALRPDLNLLAEGWEAEDVRAFSAPGATQLLLGAYDYLSGTRYPAEALGTAVPDDALMLPVEGCR